MIPPTTYAVIDVETTGLRPQQDRLVEFGALLLDQEGQEEGFESFLVNPGIPIPWQVSQVHGITDSDVAAEPRFSEIATCVFEALSGRVIVGHNVSFDISFIAAELQRTGTSWEPVAKLDTLHASRRTLRGLRSHKLTVLRETLEIRTGAAHRVEADIRATWELACRLGERDKEFSAHPFRSTIAVPPHLLGE